MSNAKAAFLPLLNTVLRPFLQQRCGMTTAFGFVEGLEVRAERLPFVADPALVWSVNRLMLDVWRTSRVPPELYNWPFPLLHTMEIAPRVWERFSVDASAAFLDVVAWLDRPPLAHVRTVEIRLPSYDALGDMLDWLQEFDPPDAWAAMTVRILPPFYYRHTRATDPLPVEAYAAFAASRVAGLVSREEVDALDPRRLVLPPQTPRPRASLPLTPRDFFRCTNLGQFRTWASPAEQSSATARAVERAVRKRPPTRDPGDGYEDDGRRAARRSGRRPS
jgi:hypothetical protein